MVIEDLTLGCGYIMHMQVMYHGIAHLEPI